METAMVAEAMAAVGWEAWAMAVDWAMAMVAWVVAMVPAMAVASVDWAVALAVALAMALDLATTNGKLSPFAPVTSRFTVSKPYTF
jgi:hypothetical protein